MSSLTAWTEALDALEAWVRRTREGLAGATAPGEAPRMPGGTVPAELHLRARLLVGAMQDAEVEGLRRREQLEREQAYGAA